MPNIAIYCVTPVVKGEQRLDRVHVINLVGYAFDSKRQPDILHFGSGWVDGPEGKRVRTELNAEVSPTYTVA